MRAYDEVHAALAAPAPGAALSALARLPELRAELDACEAALIEAARDGGTGWAAIATALGLSSRQAGEQRLARLRRRVPGQQNVDVAGVLADTVSALAAAVAADPGWDGRSPRAALARQCLDIAAGLSRDDPPGGLFSLVNDVLGDLGGLSRTSLPEPQRAAITRLERAARDAGVTGGQS
ncbi:hypothetical protein [Catenuloplanes japonicus]|uniref:hypothetical protein n=1 Tax=Catenuloplanes japonicus TaxID=33876 RepID=UPI000689F905|nr:hypothetical protein [Catenuloplanes japonicus]